MIPPSFNWYNKFIGNIFTGRCHHYAVKGFLFFPAFNTVTKKRGDIINTQFFKYFFGTPYEGAYGAQ